MFVTIYKHDADWIDEHIPYISVSKVEIVLSQHEPSEKIFVFRDQFPTSIKNKSVLQVTSEIVQYYIIN